LTTRPYDPEQDFDAVLRIWHEVGWIEKGNDDQTEGLKVFAEQYRGLVVDLDESPECYVATGLGSIRHTGSDLSLSAVTAVTTSHIARRQGLAQRLTARAIALDAADGAMVSALGIFDQGFYNKLGFGSGSYERWHALDPADLRVPRVTRRPRRLSKDDWEIVHQSRLNRRRGHGACSIDAEAATRAEMLWATNGFGLGYADGPDGELTHHLWINTKSMENGPLSVWWMSFQNTDQFLELIGLIANLGDQVHLVRMREPAGIQLQDLLHQPFRRSRISEKSQYEARTSSFSYFQLRICHLAACVSAAQLDGTPVRFNLSLSDPIEQILEGEGTEWRGVAGDYVVEFGPTSSAERGHDPSLPTLQAGVGAFTRLWLGVLPATGLAVTDDLEGPADLLADLDRILCLPAPKPDWDF
jgi:GNAT superfamily N-acetyltransferase